MGVSVLLLLSAVIGTINCGLLELSCDQIKQFVNGHNWRRELLAKGKVNGQPAASLMNYMIWDSELASKAAYWASQLRQQHNNDRTIPSGRFTTGENLYWYYTTDFNYNLSPDSALESWFAEYKDFTYGPMSSNNLNAVGHYTQMAWSDTTYVGCAMSQWSDGGWNKYFVVCNYGPPGNYNDQAPYQSGNPAGRLTCSIGDCSRPYGNTC